LGSIYAAASTFYLIERWSLLRSTFAHFAVLTVTMIIVAYTCCWMPHNIYGVLGYLLTFVIVYAIIWFVEGLYWRRRIHRINARLQKD
jgi:hypothetical protein